MADSNKNILITPATGTTSQPSIDFTGYDNNTVSLNVVDDGGLSIEGSAGQLFSITDDLSGTIFSVNDVSGIPSMEVDDDGTVRLAEFTGNVLVGTATDDGINKVQIEGNLSVSGRIQGIDTVSADTDATNKLYVDTAVANAGGGGSTLDAVASGTLSNGDKVVVNSDGTVSVVALSTTIIPQNLLEASSSYPDANGTASDYYAIAFIPGSSDTFLLLYHNSQDAVMRKCFINGSSIQFEINKSLGSKYSTKGFRIAFDPFNSENFVIVYSSDYLGVARVVTIGLDGQLQLGPQFYFSYSDEAQISSISFDPFTANRFVIGYVEFSNSYATAYQYLYSCTMDTSLNINFRSKANLGSNSMQVHVAFNKHVESKLAVAMSQDFSNRLKFMAYTISSTNSLAQGSATYIYSFVDVRKLEADPFVEGRYIIAAKPSFDAPGVIVAQITSNSPTLSNHVVFPDASTADYVAIFDPFVQDKVVAVYQNTSNDTLTFVEGTITSSGLVWGASTGVISSSHTSYESMGITFSDTVPGVFAVCYPYGVVFGQTGSVITTQNLSASNYIGISDGSYTNGDTASIQVVGSVNEAQSGLEAGEKYYVQKDNTLLKTPDEIEVFAGTAVSNTKIIIKG